MGDQGRIPHHVETFPAIPLTRYVPLLGKGGLLDRFNPSGHPLSQWSADLWLKGGKLRQGYSIAELNRRSLVNEDEPEPEALPPHMRGMLLESEHRADPSSYFGGENVAKMRVNFLGAQAAWFMRNPNVTLLLQNLADIVIINAQRREYQDGIQDPIGSLVTRVLPQLDAHYVENEFFVGAAKVEQRAKKGEFQLDKVSANHGSHERAVGLTVGPAEVQAFTP